MLLLKILFIYAIAIIVGAQFSKCQRGYRCVPLKRLSIRRQVFKGCRLRNGLTGICCNINSRKDESLFPHVRNGPRRLRSRIQRIIKLQNQAGCTSGLQSQVRNSPCVPLILCLNIASVDSIKSMKTCSLSDGSRGVICPSNSDNRKEQVFLPANENQSVDFLESIPPSSATFPLSTRNSSDNVLDAETVQRAIRFAGNNIGRGQELPAATTRRSGFRSPPPSGPSTLQFLNHQVSNPSRIREMGALSNFQLLSQIADQNINENEQRASSGSTLPSQPNFSTRQSQQATSSSPISDGTSTDSSLPNCSPIPVPKCQESLYRTIDGTCNNLLDPNLGAGLKGFKRYLPNTYDDGIFKFRTKSVLGGVLPSARTISNRIFDTESREFRGMTLSVMQFGQFIDHDFTHQILTSSVEPRPIECCQDNGRVFPAQPLHPQCIPIQIDKRDSFYSRFEQRCMSMVRTLPAPSLDCQPRPGVPFNELTSYLDSSNVYGSQIEQASRIRTFYDGLLKTSKGNLLPMEGVCRGKICFLAGETRVNEQSGLAIMHTIFHREHNRVARELKKLNGPLDDEKLYQMSRRIVIAEWQHIIYREWLPLVVGPKYAAAHGLQTSSNGHSFQYSTGINPVISTEFATAAFRFGHSLVRSSYDFIDADGKTIRTVNLTSTFFNPESLTRYLNEHSRTLVARRGETVDEKISSALLEKLFTTNGKFGLDLTAINIQRGRDHGIATYLDMLHTCTRHRVNHWSDLRNLMSSENIDSLRSVYAHPADVDLFAGGMMERPAFQAIVGPTFQCLITQQFMELRYGDRFFYDNGGMPHSFSVEQLNEIRKASWARIMCDNLRTKNRQVFDRVQPLAFFEEDNVFNQVAHCKSLAIPRVDLSMFKA